MARFSITIAAPLKRWKADVANLQEIEQLEKRVERHTKIAAAAKPAKKTTKGKKA